MSDVTPFKIDIPGRATHRSKAAFGDDPDAGCGNPW